MDPLLAIQKTKVYAQYFHFPLSAHDTYFWLISPRRVSQAKITPLITPLSSSDQKLKRKLQQTTLQKTTSAIKILRLLHFCPSILFVGLTGSVAAHNSHPDDDLDLIIITSPHTLWLTRPIFLLALSVFFKRRHPGDSKPKTKDTFCPNLWLDTTSLAIPETMRNVYTAHEVLQVKPIFDRGSIFQYFLSQNRWTSKYLANAYHELTKTSALSTNKSFTFFLAPLNLILFLFQYLYMLPKKTSEKVTLHSAYFHKNNPSVTLTKKLSSLN